jgi:hypothetical protein
MLRDSVAGESGGVSTQIEFALPVGKVELRPMFKDIS